jgi:hypothetical protein
MKSGREERWTVQSQRGVLVVCWMSAGRGAASAGQSDDQPDRVGMVPCRTTTDCCDCGTKD